MAGWKGGHKALCKALAYQEALRGMVHLEPKEEGGNLNWRNLSNYNVIAVKKQVALTWTLRDQPGQ